LRANKKAIASRRTRSSTPARCFRGTEKACYADHCKRGERQDTRSSVRGNCSRWSMKRPRLDSNPARLATIQKHRPENAQPAIGTLALVKGLAWCRSWFNAPDSAHQPVEGSQVIERVTEFDPGRSSQKRGQATALRSLRAR
jgi:hypothetical protein